VEGGARGKYGIRVITQNSPEMTDEMVLKYLLE
jgi:hypothetical protein